MKLVFTFGYYSREGKFIIIVMLTLNSHSFRMRPSEYKEISRISREIEQRNLIADGCNLNLKVVKPSSNYSKVEVSNIQNIIK